MAGVKKIPMRMCVACRRMQPKNGMLRIVKSGDSVAIDATGKAAGRGAYLCNARECMERCCKNKLLNKAFECNVPAETYQAIREAFVDE